MPNDRMALRMDAQLNKVVRIPYTFAGYKPTYIGVRIKFKNLDITVLIP